MTHLRDFFLMLLTIRTHIPAIVFAGFVLVSLALKRALMPEILLTGLSFAAITQSGYLFSKAQDNAEDEINMPEERLTSRQRGRCVLAAWVCFFLPLPHILPQPGVRAAYFFLALLGVLYSYPFGAGRWRIKNHVLTKTLSMCTFMACAILAAPFLDAGLSPRLLITMPSVPLELCGILIITSWSYDIRDVVGDRSVGMRTFPVLFGVRATVVVLAAIIVAQAWPHMSGGRPGFELFFSVVLLALVVTLPTVRDPRTYHALPLWMLFRLVWRIAHRLMS